MTTPERDPKGDDPQIEDKGIYARWAMQDKADLEALREANAMGMQTGDDDLIPVTEAQQKELEETQRREAEILAAGGTLWDDEIDAIYWGDDGDEDVEGGDEE